MVSARQKRQATGARSMYNRIMRLVVPIIMGTFLIIGLVLLLGIRANAQETLTQRRHVDITDFQNGITNELQRRVESLSGLANERDAREFARDTLVNSASTTINNSQTRLLGDFTSLMQQNPSYLAARYVTFNGSVWSEVTNYDQTVPRADAGVKLGVFADDPSLTQALKLGAGQVVVSEITYQLNPHLPILDRLVPYLRLSAPVVPDSTIDTNVAGVIQIDVQVTPILDYVRSAANTKAADEEGRRIIIADASGNILYDTANPEIDYVRALALGQSPSLNAQYPSESALFQPDAAVVDAQIKGENIFSTGRVPFSDHSSGYWFVSVIDNASALQNSSNLVSIIALVGSLLLGALISLFISLILRRTLRPIGDVNSLVSQWTNGAASETVVMPSISEIAPDDEIGQLMHAFQGMTDRVEALKAEMGEQQGRYTRNMDIAARVSRETATLFDIDALLNRAINLICDEFGYYHAQVFLIDDIGENAVLVYSHGEVGQQLLQASHKILVGSESVIGRVTRNGQTVVVNDTTSGGAEHRFNPLLPQTRAEIALPLLSGERILGALDVQSFQSNSFQADEVRTFEILADQIAVAIQNVRLLVQSEERITQIDTLNRQLTRSAWQETGESSGLEPVYRYDLLDLRHDEPNANPALSLPISIRGEVVGTLDATAPENVAFTDGDQVIMRAVADRVAIAIENARLFEETQSSLSETFTLYQLSRYLNEADSLEDILQAIIVSVMPDAVSGQIGVFDDYVTTPQRLEFTVDWVGKGEEHASALLGTHMHFDDHVLLHDMEQNQVTLITDTARDKRIDTAFKAIVQTTGARSMVFIPFSVRAVWRGIIMIEFPTPRQFSEREGRIYGALIDQAGVAIDNRMLLHQNELALAEIERLYVASRNINMAQSLPDLIRAAFNANNNPRLNFELSVLEGEIDATGWPTTIRRVARSVEGEVISVDEISSVSFAAEFAAAPS